MKVKMFYFLVLLSAVVVMTGCRTVENFSLVDGYEHGSRKDVVKVKFFAPADTSHLTKNQLQQLYTYPETALISNKRVVILSDSKGTLSGTDSHDIEIRPHVDWSIIRNAAYTGYGCLVKLDMRINNKEEGAYEDGGSGMKLSGYSKVTLTNKRYDNSTVSITYDKLFNEAYSMALKKLIARINCIYPVNGTVNSMKNKGEVVEFKVDRGTNYGLTSNDKFVIYYLDGDENITPVALAKGMVGKTNSQLTVTSWNTDDYEVKKILKPRILRGDRSLLGKLYFVSK